MSEGCCPAPIAYKVGSGAAGGGAIGTGFWWMVCNGVVGPGTDQSWVTVEEITLSPACGGAVSSASPVADGEGPAVELADGDCVGGGLVVDEDCDGGWLVAEGCGAGGVHAARTIVSVMTPPMGHAIVLRFQTAFMLASPPPSQRRRGRLSCSGP